MNTAKAAAATFLATIWYCHSWVYEALSVMEDDAFPGAMAPRGLENDTSTDLVLNKGLVEVLMDGGTMTANQRASVCQVKG